MPAWLGCLLHFFFMREPQGDNLTFRWKKEWDYQLR